MLFISNLMLDLYNIKVFDMKNTKTMLWLLIAGTFTFMVGLGLYSTKASLGTFEYAIAGLVLIAVLFSVVMGMKRLKQQKQGLTVDDELSHLIKQKAAASAFAWSFYAWVMIILFFPDAGLDLEIPIGIGILAMTVLFLGFWVYYSKSGISSDHQD